MKKILLISAPFLLLFSCTKRAVEPIDFNVTTVATTYKVGDSVVFNFTGNPDFITFFSGEPGHEYKYITRDFEAGTPIMNFSSYRQYGIHDSTLHVMISTDFTGSYTPGGVDSATWTDITNRATLSTGANNTPSGDIDLSDFAGQNNTPLFVGFKYYDTTNSAGTSSLRTWTITNFSINTTFGDSSIASVAMQATAGWKKVIYADSAAAWVISNTANPPLLKMNGGAAGTPENYNWVISAPFYPNKIMPDAGVVLKNISARLPQYIYQFAAPGVYNITFLAVNENIYGRSQEIKTIQITVTQ